MRIAILSDIHGNLPALEAALADVEGHGVDEIWCGGDVAFFGPWASECIARVRDAGWPAVKGNTDVWITGDPQGGVDEALADEIVTIAGAHAISDEDVSWLLNLPLGHPGPASSLMVHATPESPFDAPMPEAPSGDFEVYEGRAQVVVYGHVHRAFVRRLKDGTLVANTGSVGLPMDGTTGSYLLLDVDGPDVVFRLQRFTFDRDAALAGAREVGGPVGSAFEQRLGGS